MQKLLWAAWRAIRAAGAFVLALVRELRDAMRQDGVASWSRYGSAAIVGAWCYVLVRTRVVPERTAEVAVLVGALYGANQVAQAVANYKLAKQAQAGAIAQAPGDNPQT